MDTEIIPPFHLFETQLTPEARQARTQTLRANANSDYSFKKMGSGNNAVSQLDIDINLRCSHLQNRLINPVRTKNCTHWDCVDLTLLVYLVFVDKKPKVCPSCKKPFNSWETDIKIDTIIKKILQNTRNDCFRVKYDLSKDNYYIIENEEASNETTEMLINIIETNKEKKNGLDKMIKKMEITMNKKFDQPLTIPLTCTFSGTRMNYPCRFKDCNHVECFDLEQLLYKFSEKMVWKCPILNCTAETSKPIKDIEIDQILLPLCLKHSKLMTVVVYMPSMKKFFIADCLDDPFYKDFEGDSENSLEEKLKLINNAYDKIILFSCRTSHDALKDGLVPNDRDEIEIDLVDRVTGILIEAPARIKTCKHLEAIELKSYLCNWGKGDMKCPLCDEVFSDPEDDLYIDKFLARALTLRIPKVIYRIREDIFLEKDKKMPAGLLMKINAKIGYDDPRYRNFDTKPINLICRISNKLMKIPVTTPNCNHPACFDLEAYAKLDPEKRPNRCPFESFCGKPIIENALVKDQVVKDILDQVSSENLDCTTVTYNFKEKRIIKPENQEYESSIESMIIQPKASDNMKFTINQNFMTQKAPLSSNIKILNKFTFSDFKMSHTTNPMNSNANQAWGNSLNQAWGNSPNQALGNSPNQARGNNPNQAWGNNPNQGWRNSPNQGWGNDGDQGWGNSPGKGNPEWNNNPNPNQVMGNNANQRERASMEWKITPGNTLGNAINTLQNQGKKKITIIPEESQTSLMKKSSIIIYGAQDINSPATNSQSGITFHPDGSEIVHKPIYRSNDNSNIDRYSIVNNEYMISSQIVRAEDSGTANRNEVNRTNSIRIDNDFNTMSSSQKNSVSGIKILRVRESGI